MKLFTFVPAAVRVANSWRHTYHQLLRSAGSHAPGLRASLRGLLAAAALQGLALACLFPLCAALFKGDDSGAIWRWLAGMTALALLATILRWRAQGFEYNGQLAAATHELRTRLGQQLRRVPLEQLHDRRAGEINAVLLGNVDENLNYTLAIVDLILVATITPLMVALAACAFDWRIGSMLLLALPLLIALYRRQRPAHSEYVGQLAQANQRTSADIVEYTQGLAALRAACSAGTRATALQAGFDALQRTQVDAHRRASRPTVVIVSVVELGLQLVVAAGVTWVTRGTLELSLLAALMVIVVRLAEPMATLNGYSQMIELIAAALTRIEALLATAPLPQQLPALTPSRFEVRFEAVSFRYAQARTAVLQQVVIDMPANRMTAVVGPSGAGKSTLLRLLMRHADPQQGRITIGGVDLRQIPATTLDALFSAVFQDVYLFDDTLLANLLVARPDASEHQVHAALQRAQCSDFVARLPQGWHTRLGDIGARLSGGERQRLSIARALLKDAPIVLLDEPTAALDSESEVAVQQAIDALLQDKTVIIIAHRLSTIAGADQILVLDQAQVVESGSHAALLAQGGRYHAMWTAQQAAKDWHAQG